jgi:class 3 adenylate cyclase
MKICFDEDSHEYFAVDMGSRHGVFIDGVKIGDKEKLVEGNCITIGQTELLFTQRDITDHQSSLSLLRSSKLDFPTVDISHGPTQKFFTDAAHGDGNRFASLRQWAGATKITLAIVFTDMVDSTILTCNLGNESMDRVRRAHFARARGLIEEHNGYEIKTNGDEFMVAFRAAVNALDFALGLYAEPGDDQVNIRAGVHIGPVIVEEEDVQGAAVSYAARVINMAERGGVWLSNEIKNHIDQEKAQHHENICWQQHPDCELKGFPGKHTLWSMEKNA